MRLAPLSRAGYRVHRGRVRSILNIGRSRAFPAQLHGANDVGTTQIRDLESEPAAWGIQVRGRAIPDDLRAISAPGLGTGPGHPPGPRSERRGARRIRPFPGRIPRDVVPGSIDRSRFDGGDAEARALRVHAGLLALADEAESGPPRGRGGNMAARSVRPGTRDSTYDGIDPTGFAPALAGGGRR